MCNIPLYDSMSYSIGFFLFVFFIETYSQKLSQAEGVELVVMEYTVLSFHHAGSQGLYSYKLLTHSHSHSVSNLLWSGWQYIQSLSLGHWV